MSAGKSRHHAVNAIQPRHFIQTAELSGVGTSVVRAIFKDLAETFEPALENVAKALPRGFPEA